MESAGTNQSKVTKDKRIAVRVSAEVQAMLNDAAAAEGRSLSDFIVHAAQKAAKETLVSNKVLKLTQMSQEHFLRCLDNPPEPNNSLNSALADHKRLIGGL